jgi:hypothetical protein
MLALTALLLSRALPYLGSTRLRHVLALYLSFLLAYGLANAVQDFQLEQIVKRGLMTYQLPMVLAPALNWAWALLLLAATAVYALAFGPLARSRAQERPSAPPQVAQPSSLTSSEDDSPSVPAQSAQASPL